jgi:type II restriction/modification system DNA methylase subunit YeeA
MSQATLPSTPYVNSNLFSSHYLDERVREREEWDCDEAAREVMEDLQAIYDMEGALVEGYNEDSLADNWISGVLDGLEHCVEASERAKELDEKIEKTDDLIDEIVYELYGLTEEEIEIVED